MLINKVAILADSCMLSLFCFKNLLIHSDSFPFSP